MSVIMDAKPLFDEIKEQVKTDVDWLKKKGINPGLAAVLTSEDAISHTYGSLSAKMAATPLGVTQHGTRHPYWPSECWRETLTGELPWWYDDVLVRHHEQGEGR